MRFVGINRIVGLIAVLEINTHRILTDRLYVAHVPLTTQHMVLTPQKLLDRLRLCRRLYYNQIFTHTTI